MGWPVEPVLSLLYTPIRNRCLVSQVNLRSYRVTPHMTGSRLRRIWPFAERFEPVPENAALCNIVTSLFFSFQENPPCDLEPAIHRVVLEGGVVLELVIEA